MTVIAEMLELLNERHGGLPIGTIHKRKDGLTYQKQRDGSWAYKAKQGPAPAAKPSPASKPAKAAPVNKGGKIKGLLGKAWGTLIEPFVGAFHLATKKSARKAFAAKIGGAVKKEAGETKELLRTLKKALTPGQKVSKEERARAINQTTDLIKVALIGTMYGHIAAQGIGELLATVASPVEEILGAMIDKPLRRATKKIFGHEHGILPSSFYGDGSEKEESLLYNLALLHEVFGGDADEQDLLRKITNAVLDELELSEEDVGAGVESGMSTAQAQKLAQLLHRA